MAFFRGPASAKDRRKEIAPFRVFLFSGSPFPKVLAEIAKAFGLVALEGSVCSL